eukprot:TRINITY_DN1079_c0_g1_i2.p1 TRINITY_DN1079_c0_g1~~TRINITY_DN1079_c0_g1_i2.p1  ORF type:complete len:126 (+),score=24.45 TRINITY_DN1079_c0_g1_i2:270-647(+)
MQSIQTFLDQRTLVVLRDGRKLIGVLRSFDQFANLVVEGTVERIYVGNQYGDVPLGVYLIRGENVVMMGQVDEALLDHESLEKVDANEVLTLQKEEQEREAVELAKKKAQMLARGVIPEAFDDLA